VNGAADGVLAGGILCLLAFLPQLLVLRSIRQESGPHHVAEAHRLTNDDMSNQKTHSLTRKSQPSDPEMSFVDLSSGLGHDEPTLKKHSGNTSSSGFTAYLNPMNMETPEEMEEGVPSGKENTDESVTLPALVPQV
jgi:hypothetical protein